ncbi:MAG: NAD(P)-dependent oxidoreductase [Deltaproteobacteria bacterium]|nr:NAD(P)-dependent oxidoreductase [Deltaproteobacteria bacterium]
MAVTGSTGNLGRAVVSLLVSAGHHVRAILRPDSGPPPDGAEALRLAGAVRDNARSALEGASVLVHLAAYGVQGRDRDWLRAVEANTVDTFHWVQAAAQVGASRSVVAGSYFEYEGRGRLPEPSWPEATSAPPCEEDSPLEAWDPYSASKAAGGVLARALARDLGHRLWYLRLASLFGPDDDPGRFIPMTVKAARARAPMPMSPGGQVRDLVHVDDAAHAVLETVTLDPAEGVETVNIGSGQGTSLLDLGRRVLALAGAPEALLRPGERPYRPREAHHLVTSTARRERLLRWTPRPLEETLPAVVFALGRRA